MAAALPNLRKDLNQALRLLSAREKKRVTVSEAARRLKLHRVDLYDACEGLPSRGFGENSKRRKKVERFIENALVEGG